MSEETGESITSFRRTPARASCQASCQCGIYNTAAGLEVLCGYSEDDLLRSELAPEIAMAREIAERWRQAVIGKGGFFEVLNDGCDRRMGTDD